MSHYWRVYCNEDTSNEVDICTYLELLVKYGNPYNSLRKFDERGWVTPRSLYRSVLFTKEQLKSKRYMDIPKDMENPARECMKRVFSGKPFALWTSTLDLNVENGYYAIPEYMESEKDFIMENWNRIYLNCRLFFNHF